MPAVVKSDPNIQVQNEVIEQVNKTYDELRQVYSKQALDDTFEKIFNSIAKLEKAIETNQIEIIRVSPFQKFINLFRRE